MTSGYFGGAVLSLHEICSKGWSVSEVGLYFYCFLTLALAIAGGFTSLILGFSWRLLRSFFPFGYFHLLPRGRRALIIMVIVPLVVSLCIGFLQREIELRGIEIRALPFESMAVLGLFLLTTSVMNRYQSLHRRVHDTPSTLSPILSVTLLLVLACFPPVRHSGTALVLESGVTGRYVLNVLRQLHDFDGDGHPHAACWDECDCNDIAWFIYPGAPEVLDNAIDEDCDGQDLHQSDLRRLGLSARKDKTERTDPTLDTESKGGTGNGQLAEKSYQNRYNVLLILIDTLRADHLSCYGYKRKTSPRLDEFANQSVLFLQARAQGAKSRESIPSILTGLYYAELDRTEQEWPIILDENIMLAEMFQAAGYSTWGITSYIYFLPQYGFAQGFDEFDTKILKKTNVHWKSTSHLVTDRVLQEIDQKTEDGNVPYFLLAHYADPHAGYIRHEESPRFGPYIQDVYDQEIFYTDLHIGRLLDGLEERGRFEDTIVLITADHGEGLDKKKDHGFDYHGQTLYDNLIRVPLMIRAPFSIAQKTSESVALLDIVPTLLDATGLEASNELKGVSLVPLLLGHEFERPPVFAQRNIPRRLRRSAIIEWPYKVIWRTYLNRWMLYDLSRDPNERKNLSRKHPEILKQLAAKLKAWPSTLTPMKKKLIRRKEDDEVWSIRREGPRP